MGKLGITVDSRDNLIPKNVLVIITIFYIFPVFDKGYPVVIPKILEKSDKFIFKSLHKFI